MEPYLVATFAGVALTLVAVPGPDWAFVLAAGARDRIVFPAVAGLMIGYSLITAAIAGGVGPLVATIPVALTVLILVGAAYLVYLGITILRQPEGIAQCGDDSGLPRRTRKTVLLRGIGVSALNPKGLLIFLAILPQFTRPNASWTVPIQIGVLGATFVFVCAVFYVALGHAADRILGSRPQVARITTRIAGAAMVIVGVVLIAERVSVLVGRTS
ncbi:LysE family translocator [Paenarthrobacter sp. PH39-S1]|uniref:LysE family translocator n=1 Tax=Paenarthrobacter sp. PH39-S1 TaxID=3046204 RepID=UPI0024B8E647|nr:LysE family translocator [Paenarthrobacter sp. PH39-S1]MDJ0356619.1 LysE family translocator [Paenarthrobacter sp. PH39-S1]